MSQDEYEALADIVVYNNGDMDELISKLDAVIEKIL